jgi:hypothetical protein
MVRIHPDPPIAQETGAVAQLGERLLCKQEVVGSIPSSSTSVGCGWFPCVVTCRLRRYRFQHCALLQCAVLKAVRSLTIRKARR